MGVGGFDEKRSLEELVFAYEMEPGLRDVYVEGRTDKVLIEHALSAHEVRVWEDGEIDIPGDLVRTHGLDVGCKGRVATIALELESRLSDKDLLVRCIVDADCDRVLEVSLVDAKYLRYTDFTCIESYFWDATHLRKYIKIGLHDTLGLTAEEVLEKVNPILKEIFLLRVAQKHLNMGWHWVSVSSCVTTKKATISFDREKFVQKYLQSNSAWDRREDLERIVEWYRPKLDNDIRHCLQGHDLTEVMSELVKECVKPKGLGQVEIVARMLAMTIDRDDLTNLPLLSEIAGNEPLRR
ncbi:DUF4435 domain-containing protein [Streptomyces sp. NPDC093970]|uniref:DUF4435 domain-containing protein n=1 Tax=Streptomyces sp. NPDC093970 TaxID=3155076 RepID=UPI003414DD9A